MCYFLSSTCLINEPWWSRRQPVAEGPSKGVHTLILGLVNALILHSKRDFAGAIIVLKTGWLSGVIRWAWSNHASPGAREMWPKEPQDLKCERDSTHQGCRGLTGRGGRDQPLVESQWDPLSSVLRPQGAKLLMGIGLKLWDTKCVMY